ncbi:MAG: DUF371 domain-containing protein [Nitrososphaerales archaeon]|nr:DUF371 domain-containing protein [Nitrososphaerales archaeon]
MVSSQEGDGDMKSSRRREAGQTPKLAERIGFRGHPMVLALHPTTIEVTTESHLTRKGDCIVGVGSDAGCAGLSEGTKEALRRDGARVVLRFVVAGESFVVNAEGDSRLTFTHPHDMVIRKSDFISDRTLAVRASAAAKDMPRRMVEALRGEGTTGYLEIGVV